MIKITVVFVFFFVLRILTLIVSIKNEKKLKSEGAVEYGKTNSLLMTLFHILFYIGSISEAVLSNASFNYVNKIGIVLFLFSYLVLWYVITQLKNIWTVKLYIAKEHKINNSFLFKYFRHPNYYLNIIPELIGIGMLCKAWIVMIIILPVYMVILIIRIIQEERAMKFLYVIEQTY